MMGANAFGFPAAYSLDIVSKVKTGKE